MSFSSPNKGDFRIVRLGPRDASGMSDHLKNFRNLVLQNEDMYPQIDLWLDEKVVPGMKTLERVAYIAYVDEVPVVSAVAKRGEHAKFCHLKIKEDLQDNHLGDVFFSLMGLEVRGIAKEIHFTLPESLWENKREFFCSFGFADAVKAGHQYRTFENELRCSSPFQKVWDTILEKLPKITRMFSVNGHSFNSSVLMSIKPEHATKVLSGTKKVEIRRTFSQKWKGHKVAIYACRPESSVVGEAIIGEIIRDRPDGVWQRFAGQMGCSKEQFERYTRSSYEVYAIVFDEVTPYEKGISLGEASEAVNERLRPPQSYLSLDNNRHWAEALSVGALLKRSFACDYRHIFV
jgi:predicted transcriptional regulator